MYVFQDWLPAAENYYNYIALLLNSALKKFELCVCVSFKVDQLQKSLNHGMEFLYIICSHFLLEKLNCFNFYLFLEAHRFHSAVFLENLSFSEQTMVTKKNSLVAYIFCAKWKLFLTQKECTYS